METDEIAKDKQARYEVAFKVLNMLAETWPGCFKHEDETPVPLAIGISQRVQAELGEIMDKKVLRRAFAIYCGRPAYRASLRQPARFKARIRPRQPGGARRGPATFALYRRASTSRASPRG